MRSPILIALLAVGALTLVACTDRSASDSAPANEPATASTVETAPPEMPADAPPQEEVPMTEAELAAGAPATADCLSEVGKAAADRLVQRCVYVSPATHPPCNVANPCAMIQGEIDRSCAMYGPDEQKPAECAA